MNEYPLHWCVFENDVHQLKNNLLKISKNEIDKKDLRGKTPLELAVFLNNFECAKVLVENGADCSIITKAGWNLVQESVSSGNLELVKLLISYRDLQRENARTNGIPELLNKLKEAPDFYVEMKWEFTSWIPLISKACPSDVYKIYKSGSNVRIDTTLIGFNGTSWERGNRSYIFQADNTGTATIIEIDHMRKTYHLDKLAASNDSSEASNSTNLLYEPDDSLIQAKLTSPNIVTFLDIEKIEFERNRSGIWGWRSDKNESINGFDCKIYTANNLQLITKTRVEHLNNERTKMFLNELEGNNSLQKLKPNNGSMPSFLNNFFQGNEQHIKIEQTERKITSLEYFQKQVHIDYYLNGSVRKIDETQKIQTFNANLSLSDTYPLSLHEQVLPIVDLMALDNSHFKKLKEFITLQLPSGFPIKIEIPLYRVITAKVTFGNIHALNHHVDHVSTIIKNDQKKPRAGLSELNTETNYFLDSESTSDTNKLITEETNSPDKMEVKSSSMCLVDECVFKIPIGYKCTNREYSSAQAFLENDQNPSAGGNTVYANQRHNYQSLDEDDILIQIAIHQSLSANENNSPDSAETESLSSLSTAILPIRDSRGSTQSLQEYQDRRKNLVYNQNDEDIILQRALAESLIVNNHPNASDGLISNEIAEDSIARALELSRLEEEQRNLRIREEEDQLQQILALSLVEK